MAYRIVYGAEKGKTRKKRNWIWLAALAAAVLLGRFLGLGQYLIPGDAAVTTAAAEEFVAQIGAGEPVQAAFSDFCREIMDHGEIY